jgi:hypothetical protein
MTRSGSLLIAALMLVSACSSVPKADPEEIEIRDQWAALVPADEREKIVAEAERHTGWGEKAKIRYEVDSFQKYVKAQDRKSRATGHRSTTRVATTPHQSTTRHATTRGATTNESDAR